MSGDNETPDTPDTPEEAVTAPEEEAAAPEEEASASEAEAKAEPEAEAEAQAEAPAADLADTVAPAVELPFAISGFIQREMDAATAASKRIVITGLLGTILVFGYLAWLHSQLEVIVNPQTLATFVADSAVNTVPEISSELESALRESAPVLVDELIDGTVRAVPDLGGALEAELGDAVDEMATFAAQQTAADLAAVLEETKAATPEARVDAAVDILLKNFEFEMNEPAAKAKKGAKGKAGQPRQDEAPTVIASLRSSLTALERIDKRLKVLAERKDLSQQQNMEKQLIQSWMSMIQDR